MKEKYYTIRIKYVMLKPKILSIEIESKKFKKLCNASNKTVVQAIEDFIDGYPTDSSGHTDQPNKSIIKLMHIHFLEFIDVIKTRIGLLADDLITTVFATFIIINFLYDVSPLGIIIMSSSFTFVICESFITRILILLLIIALYCLGIR